jgi:hypothetical protein
LSIFFLTAHYKGGIQGARNFNAGSINSEKKNKKKPKRSALPERNWSPEYHSPKRATIFLWVRYTATGLKPAIKKDKKNSAHIHADPA